MEETDKVQEIIEVYNKLVRNIESSAISSQDGRAYGGILRAGKGNLVEGIGKQLIHIAWGRLGQNHNRLKIIGKRIEIPIKKEYLEKIKDEKIKEHIKQQLSDYSYSYKPDILLSIDDNYVLEMECKAYTENAMFKRILVDATLLQTLYPDMQFVLLQLESQLGGDFSELREVTFGSTSTHTLLSYFDINLHIITLLKGERKVDRPIHKPEFFKPLTRGSIETSIKVISKILGKHMR